VGETLKRIAQSAAIGTMKMSAAAFGDTDGKVGDPRKPPGISTLTVGFLLEIEDKTQLTLDIAKAYNDAYGAAYAKAFPAVE